MKWFIKNWTTNVHGSIAYFASPEEAQAFVMYHGERYNNLAMVTVPGKFINILIDAIDCTYDPSVDLDTKKYIGNRLLTYWKDKKDDNKKED